MKEYLPGTTGDTKGDICSVTSWISRVVMYLVQKWKGFINNAEILFLWALSYLRSWT